MSPVTHMDRAAPQVPVYKAVATMSKPELRSRMGSSFVPVCAQCSATAPGARIDALKRRCEVMKRDLRIAESAAREAEDVRACPSPSKFAPTRPLVCC